MNNKNYTISIIRLISMLMIITCHILQGLNNKWAFWINVGVQIFFFISGFLYGKKDIDDIKSFYIKKIKKILIPYIFVLAISLLLEAKLLNNHYTFHQILGGFLGYGAFIGNISILSHTWFVSYILLCYLIIPILQNIFKNKKFNENIALFFLIVILIHLFQKYGVVNIEATWINNFIIGYFYSKSCKTKNDQKKFEVFLLVLFLIIIPLAIIYQENIPISLPDFLSSHSNIIINYGHVMLGSVLFIILYKIFNKLKIKNNIVLSFSDKYSYYIYLVHQIFILNSFSVLFLTKYLVINIILILVLSILSAIIIKKLSDILLYILDYSYQKLKKVK